MPENHSNSLPISSRNCSELHFQLSSTQTGLGGVGWLWRWSFCPPRLLTRTELLHPPFILMTPVLAVIDGPGVGTHCPKTRVGERSRQNSLTVDFLFYAPTAKPTDDHTQPWFKSFSPLPGLSPSFLQILILLFRVPSRLILGEAASWSRNT